MVAHSSGCAPYSTTSPRHQISPMPAASMSASTASSAGRFAWVSLISHAVCGAAPTVRVPGRLAGRRVLGAAAAGAGLPIVLAVATVPVGVAAHERAVDSGISVQSLGAWLGDVGKSAAITAVVAAGGAALLLALVRRLGGWWWVPGTVA